MNWDDLKIFLAVSRSGSLSRAATVLNVDQSTVGRRLSALEAGIGATLFKRSKSGLALTNAGEKLLPKAMDVERDIEQMVNEAAEEATGPSGLVRLLSNAWILDRLASRALPAFLSLYPGISVRMITHRPRLRTREDATISLWFEAPAREGEHSIRLGEVPFAVYGREGANPEALDWVSFYDEDAPNRAPVRAWKRQRKKSDLLRVTATDANLLLTSVRAGLGKGLLPMCLGETVPGLIRIPGSQNRLDRALHMQVHPDTMQSQRVQATMAWLRDTFEDIFLP